MLRTRRELLSMLHSSAFTTGIHLVSEGPGHSHRITIKSTRNGNEAPQYFTAVLLIRSSDWYKYRLNVFGQVQGIELVVCGEHDSCLPVPVWSVEDAKIYQEGETTTPLVELVKRERRGTKYGSLLFIAALLSGKQEVLAILSDPDFPRSTRYRYKAKAREYANLKPGIKLKID